MNKVEIKHKITGKVLYTHEGDDLSCADLSTADLRSANLRFANLSSANLIGVDLSCADLSCADLSSAVLRSANLRCANLRCADLSSADLSTADLRSADLSSANLRSANLRVYQSGLYTVYATSTFTRIGCQVHENQGWRDFDDEKISEMASDALPWWEENKAIVFALMDSLEAQFPIESKKEEAAA